MPGFFVAVVTAALWAGQIRSKVAGILRADGAAQKAHTGNFLDRIENILGLTGAAEHAIYILYGVGCVALSAHCFVKRFASCTVTGR
ncbi:MAG: hypothetical protein RL341_2551 [Pseudomonadota bacterium]|jgi:hypothetical protein